MAALELVGGLPNPNSMGQEEGSSGYPQEKSECWTGKPQTAMQQPHRCSTELARAGSGGMTVHSSSQLHIQ